MSFTHLNLHTEYSINNGIGKIDKIVKRVKELGQDSVAITDDGVMYGVVEFFKTCIVNGVKPIIGAEVYVANGSRFDKKPDMENNHLILLCENNEGYQNLVNIVSIGNTEGFYYLPRVDYETLEKYSKGLICLSGGPGGEIARYLSIDKYDEAKSVALKLKGIYGDNSFYIEIQNHGTCYENKIHDELIKLAKETNIPLVATNNCYYVLKEDSVAQDCFVSMQMGQNVIDAKKMFEPEKYYITSETEMRELFSTCEEAVDNTSKIAKRCNVCMEFAGKAYDDLINSMISNKCELFISRFLDNYHYKRQKNDNIIKLIAERMSDFLDLDFDKAYNFTKEFMYEGIIIGDENIYKNMIKKCDYHVPKFEAPNGMSSEDYLRKLVNEGLEKKYKLIDDANSSVVKERVKYELDVIIKNNFTDYFLLVYDIVNFAKTNNIPVGPGRGSAVGSVVLYALDVTNVDPIKYGLIFERFINEERITMPDIDIDVSPIGRNKIIEYIKSKYGENNVTDIVTFGRIYTKSLLRRPKETIDFSEDTTNKLDDITRASSIHASGICIVTNDKSNCIPLKIVKVYRVNDENENTVVKKCTQYDMRSLENLGYLKQDILGLQALDDIKDCIGRVKNDKGIDIDINSISYDDEKIYKMISDGDTKGVFESEGYSDFAKKFKPSTFEDLAAMYSIYRPGPIDYIDEFCERKHNKDKIMYYHPKLEKILMNTYGHIVYQEQIMQIFNELAGYTLTEADLARRVISKKKPMDIIVERNKFIYVSDLSDIKGCIVNGIPEELANRVFDKLVKFAPYAFNKSHATAFATLAYQTAYLKYYYKEEYFANKHI